MSLGLYCWFATGLARGTGKSLRCWGGIGRSISVAGDTRKSSSSSEAVVGMDEGRAVEEPMKRQQQEVSGLDAFIRRKEGVCGWDRANTKRSRLRHNFFMQLLQYTIIDAASRNPHFYFHHNSQCQCCWGQHARLSNETAGKYATVDYLLAVARGTIPTVSVDNSQDQTSA